MNFRRNLPRQAGRRGKSSDWSYPFIEKGSLEQGRVATKRRAAISKESVEAYSDEIGRKIPYRR